MTAPISARKPLDTLRDRIRRFQFIVGLGFASLVVGAIVSAAIAIRISERMAGSDSLVLGLLAMALVPNLWVYAVLPVFCYGAARIIPLHPWSTAVGAATVGAFFYLALDLITGQAELTTPYGVQLLTRAVMFALGILLSAHAIRRARADADAVRVKARAAATEKKDEYAEFAREAERLAARREVEGAAAADPAPDSLSAIGDTSAGASKDPASDGEPPATTDSPPTDTADRTKQP